MAHALGPRHQRFVFAPTAWRAFASTLRRTIYRSQRRRRDLRVTPLRLIVIARDPKTGRRMTFLIASLCILILIILHSLLIESGNSAQGGGMERRLIRGVPRGSGVSAGSCAPLRRTTTYMYGADGLFFIDRCTERRQVELIPSGCNSCAPSCFGPFASPLSLASRREITVISNSSPSDMLGPILVSPMRGICSFSRSM